MPPLVIGIIAAIAAIGAIAFGWIYHNGLRTPETPHENENSRNNHSVGNIMGNNQNENNKVHPNKKITYDISKPIGMSNATVFEGRFENGITVAVKKVPIDSDDREQIIHEFEDLQKKLKRPIEIGHRIMQRAPKNVIKYFGYQIEGNFLLFALELCSYHLEEFILQHRHNCPPILDKDIFVSLAKGLDFLHSRDIVHRDLKPSNVLIKIDNNNVIVKLSDFSMSKTLPETSSVASGSNEGGTLGWMAPEIYTAYTDENSVIRFNRKSDIFPLGLLFYFVASGGHYAFNTQIDIQNNDADYGCITSNDPLYSLVTDMHRSSFGDRLSAREVKIHPALWSDEKVLDFFTKTSNLLIGLPRNNTPFTQNPLKVTAGSSNQLSPCQAFDWCPKLTPGVQQDLFPSIRGRKQPKIKGPKYDKSSIDSLIRAIRNNNEHYYQLAVNLRNEYGSYPTGYLSYWTTNFPGLLMYTYDAMKVHSGDATMAKFYK